MNDEDGTPTPGGSVGCDVCGIDLAQERVSTHRAWHRREEDRLDRLTRSVDRLLSEGRGDAAAR